MWVCNTIPSLWVNFQVINVWVIELGMLTEHHPEVDLVVSLMKQIQGCFGIFYITLWFPSVIFFSISFPMDKIFHMLSLLLDFDI
jgi:hypothetical protein